MTPIDHLLRERIGLDAVAIGPGLVERAVRLRMKRLGVASVDDYESLVRTSAPEWDELVESVVIPETWFFREPESFSAFVRLALEVWLPAHREGCMRVLSVACASGEEPYSVAMALRDAEFPPERFQIEGMDISRRAVERAERGVYGRNSFRGKGLEFKRRYFLDAPEGFRLDPALRRNVRLHCGNLLEDQPATAGAPFDFIFCRNLLIYFDPVKRKAAFERLARLLQPAGVLFVGTAEFPLALEMGFSAADGARSVACRKTTETPRRRLLRSAVPPTPPPQGALPAEQPGGLIPANAASASPPRSRSVRQRRDDLSTARRLADEGKLKEAAELCRAHLRDHGASAAAYYLLGLVQDAGSQRQAGDYYRKAVYFEPDHHEALWQLAMLAQENGDTTQALALKRRAQRAQQKTGIEL